MEVERLPNPPEPGLEMEASSDHRLWCLPSDLSPSSAKVALGGLKAVPAVLSLFVPSQLSLSGSAGLGHLCGQQALSRQEGSVR